MQLPAVGDEKQDSTPQSAPGQSGAVVSDDAETIEATVPLGVPGASEALNLLAAVAQAMPGLSQPEHAGPPHAQPSPQAPPPPRRPA